MTITARFRKYRNVTEGIKGYYDFLQNRRYQNLRGKTDYNKACDLIRQDGWATSLSYAENLKKYIRQYELDKYDRQVLGIKDEGFTTGTYTLTASAIKVREGAGTQYLQRKAKDTVGASANTFGRAVYKKGTAIKVSEIIRIKDDEISGRTVDGYVALMFGGKKYVESIRD